MSNPDQLDKLQKNLKQKNESRTLNIWIPSLKRGVEFKHLTLNQQKRLIQSSIRENLLKLDFSRNIYQILVENLADPQVDVDKLNIVDMICIGLAYRAADISSDYGFYVEDDFFPVDLNTICEKSRKIDYGDMFDPETIVADNYHVTVQVPYIKTDKLMNDNLFNIYQDVPEDSDELKDLLSCVDGHRAGF